MMGSDFGFAFPIAFIVLSLLWGIFAALLLILNYYYCCKNKKTSVWYEFSDMIVDGVYLSANFVLILIILLNEYCFAPNQGRPGDLEIFSPFQTYVLHPAIYMLLSTLKYIWDNVFPLCSSAELKIRPGRVKRSSIRVVLIIFGLMFSTGMFLLKYDGYCCLELLNRPCKPIEYEIKAESCTLTIVTSSVKSPDNFEDSHLIVKYCYKSLLSDDLHNMLSYPEYSIQHVAAKNWSSVDENNFSSHDVWNKAQPKPLLINENVKRLNAKSGLTFLFPCANVNYLQTIRPNVTCFLRIQSQYSSGPSLQISYKTDVIFKYPESVEKNAQWERRDNFSSIFSATSRESLQALKVSFEHIDQQIAKMDFSEDVPQGGDLFSEKPKLVEISCLNSCFCYDCYFQDNKTLPANCTDVCRHVDWNFFGKSDREAFCSDDDSNRCDYKYVPVSEAEKLLNLPRNKLLSHLKPIEIKVNFGNRTENPSIQNAVYDPNMSMPAPESSFEGKCKI